MSELFPIQTSLRPWRANDGPNGERRYQVPLAVQEYWDTLSATPWFPGLCPPEGDCRGFYSEHQLECPHREKRTCPRRLDIKRARRHEWLSGIGFGKEYWAVEAVMVRQRRELDEYCRVLYAGDLAKGVNLILTGGVGTGKTMALAYLTCQAMPAGLPRKALRMFTAPELVAWLFKPEHDPAALGELPILMVDDLGTEHWSERNGWAVSRMNDLVERRHRAKLPTIITSNLNTLEMTHRDEWERWTDRWFARCEAIRFDCASRR